MISPEQIGFFHDNGYLKCGRILDSKQVEEMRAGLDRVLDLEAAGGDDSHHEFGFGRRRGGEEYPDGRVITQFINMWKREAMYAHIMHHLVIAGVVCALLDTPRVRLWHDQIISKPPGDNGHFEFHQDFYLWPLGEPRLVSCWLALDDVTTVNGCMQVVPASHRDPRFGLELTPPSSRPGSRRRIRMRCPRRRGRRCAMNRSRSVHPSSSRRANACFTTVSTFTRRPPIPRPSNVEPTS